MPWHTIERKVEDALKTYFQTVLTYEIADAQFVTRFSNEDLTEPRIEIYCPACRPFNEEVGPYSGNWEVDCIIKVVSHYDQSGTEAEAHDNIMGNLVDKILVVDDNGNEAFASQVNATLFDVDLQVIQLMRLGERTNSIEEHSLVTEQELSVLVMPSNQGDT